MKASMRALAVASGSTKVHLDLIGSPNSRPNGKDRINPLSAVVTVVGNSVLADDARRAMGMPWATRDGCSQAVPPAYTELLGTQLLAYVVVGVTNRGELARKIRDLPSRNELGRCRAERKRLSMS